MENNADINTQDKALHAPLHMAANTGRIDTIQLLLEHNADIDLEDEDEQTPLDFAIERYIYEYQMSSIFIKDPPTLNMSNIYQKNIPLLIKDGDNKKWIYGYTLDGQVSLIQLDGDPSIYETIDFTDQFSLLDKKRVHPNIYLDIAIKNGHSDKSTLEIIKNFMIHIRKLEEENKPFDLSEKSSEMLINIPVLFELYNQRDILYKQRYFLSNHYKMSQTPMFFQLSHYNNKQMSASRASLADVEFVFKQ